MAIRRNHVKHIHNIDHTPSKKKGELSSPFLFLVARR